MWLLSSYRCQKEEEMSTMNPAAAISAFLLGFYLKVLHWSHHVLEDTKLQWLLVLMSTRFLLKGQICMESVWSR